MMASPAAVGSPMEVRPVLLTVKSVEVEFTELEPIAKSMLGLVLHVVVEVNIEKSANGEEVPTPTLPEAFTIKSVLVEEPMTNCGTPPVRPFPFIERSPHGEVVPTPRSPVGVICNALAPEDCATSKTCSVFP